MKFTNVNVLKEEKRMKKNLIIGVVLGILAIVFFVIGGKVEENNIKATKDLHSIIISKDENKDGVLSYIDAKRVPLKFAGYDDTTDAYYLITTSKLQNTNDEKDKIDHLFDSTIYNFIEE